MMYRTIHLILRKSILYGKFPQSEEMSAGIENLDQAITITFSDVAENGIRMQKIGTPQSAGLTVIELIRAKKLAETAGYKCDMIDLNQSLPPGVTAPQAAVLIIRDGVNFLGKLPAGHEPEMIWHDDGFIPSTPLQSLWSDMCNLDPDKKKLGRYRPEPVNSIARYNLCIGDDAQSPDIENGKGTIIPFKQLPVLKLIRERLHRILGEKCRNLVAETNHYYDISKCGIGFHGDEERIIVVAIRLGIAIPLHYQWYTRSQPIGQRIVVPVLNHGDIYIMSEKAVGKDFKSSSQITLRHAAGADKYLNLR